MASLKAHPASEVKSPYPSTLFDPIVDCGTEGCGDSTNAIKPIAKQNNLSMHLAGRTLSISGTTAAKVDLFNMLGRPVFSAKNVKGSVELKVSEGLYVARVREGSKSLMKRITIK
jgi:endo-1,4-beta-xylanase